MRKFISATLALLAIGGATIPATASADSTVIGGYTLTTTATGSAGTDSYGKAEDPNSYGKADASVDSYGKS